MSADPDLCNAVARRTHGTHRRRAARSWFSIASFGRPRGEAHAGAHNRLVTLLGVFLSLSLSGCGTNITVILSPPGGVTEPLTPEEVDGIIRAAASAIDRNTLVIAVTDREGNVLGLFRKPDAPTQVTALLARRFVDVDSNELAVSLARTASFFSNDQAPLSSTTVRFISREHFPPAFNGTGIVTGVKDTPSGALWDIENTNRGCELSNDFTSGFEVSPARSLDRSTPGLGIATIPGGVPLYKLNKVVGGIGVAGVAPNLAEFAALAGSTGFRSVVAPPGEVFIDGVRLPFVDQAFRPAGTASSDPDGAYLPIPDLTNPGGTITATQGSPRTGVPEGWLVGPKSSPELSTEAVRSIIENAVFRANRTRAVIRLPQGVRARFVLAVTSLTGEVLGLFRMPDATVFSIDVAVTKARNVVYFSSADRVVSDLPGVPLGTAVTNRTLRFGSQPFFPPGIGGSFPGPFVNLRLQNQDNPCTQGSQSPGPNQSGIVFFPGSAPLYRFGVVLVGGLGVSGDGVDQDDYVTAGGILGYEAAPFLRADNIHVRGVTLPYLKFPRAPEE